MNSLSATDGESIDKLRTREQLNNFIKLMLKQIKDH